MLFRSWSECVVNRADLVARQALRKEVAATNGAAKFRMPSTKFPKVYQFEESVITASGAPSIFIRRTDATATDFNNVIKSDLLAAHNTADYSGLSLGLKPSERGNFVDSVRLSPLAAGGIRVLSGGDGTLDVCVPLTP